jgi:hypothetical protein
MKRFYRSFKKCLGRFFPPRNRVSQYARRMAEFLSTQEKEKRFTEKVKIHRFSLRAKRLARVLRLKMKMNTI